MNRQSFLRYMLVESGNSLVYGAVFFIKNLMRLRGKLGDRESHGVVQGGMKPEQQLRLNQTHAGFETANMRNNICHKKEEHSPSMISENLRKSFC